MCWWVCTVQGDSAGKMQCHPVQQAHVTWQWAEDVGLMGLCFLPQGWDSLRELATALICSKGEAWMGSLFALTIGRRSHLLWCPGCLAEAAAGDAGQGSAKASEKVVTGSLERLNISAVAATEDAQQGSCQ